MNKRTVYSIYCGACCTFTTHHPSILQIETLLSNCVRPYYKQFVQPLLWGNFLGFSWDMSQHVTKLEDEIEENNLMEEIGSSKSLSWCQDQLENASSQGHSRKEFWYKLSNKFLEVSQISCQLDNECWVLFKSQWTGEASLGL